MLRQSVKIFLLIVFSSSYLIESNKIEIKTNILNIFLLKVQMTKIVKVNTNFTIEK